MNIASVAGLIAAIVSLVILALQNSLFATGNVAIAIQVLAVFLMIWARLTFGRRSFHAAANPTEGGLVTTGPYKYLRHPIYAAAIYFCWAGVLTHFSLLHSLLGLLAIAGLSVRMLAEERLVTERYPDYADYAARTKRVVPFVF